MYRTNLESVTADLSKAKQKFQRNALLSGAGGSGRPGGGPLDFDKSTDQRTRMMNTTDTLRGGTDQLDAAHRQLEETIDVGALRTRAHGARAARRRRMPAAPRAARPLPHAATHTPTPRAGEGIVSELGRNRETLTRIRGNVGIVSGTLDEARRILRSMGRREVRTKIAVALFAVILLAIIIGLIVWLNKKGGGSTPQ